MGLTSTVPMANRCKRQSYHAGDLWSDDGNTRMSINNSGGPATQDLPGDWRAINNNTPLTKKRIHNHNDYDRCAKLIKYPANFVILVLMTSQRTGLGLGNAGEGGVAKRGRCR